MFILHMSNKKVQEKLCTEPTEPDQTLEFANAFEEGVKRQKANGSQALENAKQLVKSEPVYSIEKTNPRGLQLLQLWGGELHHGTCKFLHGHQSPL